MTTEIEEITMASNSKQTDNSDHEDDSTSEIIVESVIEESDGEDGDVCHSCQRLMSHMRKLAVRCLYMEWYKKSVMGLNLPTISELTPTLATTLKENQEGKHCESCHTHLDDIIARTLQPMNRLSDMYSSLPKNFNRYHIKKQGTESQMYVSTRTQHNPPKTSAQTYYMEKDNNNSAGSFFLRAAQKLNLGLKPSKNSSLKKMKRKTSEISTEVEDNRRLFLTNFSDLIMRTPPQAPPSLFKHGTIRRGDGHGKAKVILRAVNKRHMSSSESCLTIDSRKKQVLLREVSTTASDSTKRFEKAPRLYSFDSIFTQETSQQELCSGSLVDLLHTVVNGNDACLMTYGYPKLGKSSIMVGKDSSVNDIGIIPCAISWLYQLIDDRKQRTGARFSVRISAVEVVGKSENLKDLLNEQGNGSMCSSNGGTSPSVYLPRERASSIQLSDFTELRAPTAEKAAFYFDAAVSSRTQPTPIVNEEGEIVEDPEERKNSNMIFTLHVYQYMIDKVGTGEVHGGRSRFHLIDLSGCSRKKRSRDNGQAAWLPLSSLGNVIVSITNGTKHIPHRDSKLTTLLREAMGSTSARITMIANVSQNPKHCFETLSTFQITSRIHRSRKRKNRYSSTSSSGGESSSDEKRKHRRRVTTKPVTPLLKTDTCQSDHHVESEFTSTSAAEESCDTVIYLGPNGRSLSDRDLTDLEHPPVMKSNPQLPSKPSPNKHVVPKPTTAVNKSPKHNKQQEKEPKTQTAFSPMKQAKPLEPIVVNVTTNTLPKSKLEEKASMLNITQTDNVDTENEKTCLCNKSSTKTDNSNQVYEQELNNNNQTSTEDDKTRQCRSENSSPCKRGRSKNQEDRKSRSCSLDRNLMNEIAQQENSLSMCRSNETISSTATVNNFERQLISHIAERFAVEEEFSTKKTDDLTDCYIDDGFDTIGVGCENYHYVGSPVSQQLPSEPNNNICTCIDRSVCYELPVEGDLTKHTPIEQEFDSAEDTEERTNKNLRFVRLRNRNSFSSCDSHLNLSRHHDKNPHSEGLSSGYESMRCESSANIHLSDSSSSEKAKSPKSRKNESVDRIIYELDDEICGINVTDEDKNRFAQTSLFRAQIKELINQRQDLKEELQQTLKRLVLNKVPLCDIDEQLREISMQSRNTPQVLSRENRILERKIRVCKSHLELMNSFTNSTPEKRKKKRNPAKIKSKFSKNSSNSSRKSYKVTSV